MNSNGKFKEMMKIISLNRRAERIISLVTALIVSVSLLSIPITASAATASSFRITNLSTTGTKTIQTGRTFTAKYKVPKKYKKCKIVWKSSDKSIATVSSKGKVSTRRFGVVTISAYISKHKSMNTSFTLYSRNIIGHRGYRAKAPENTAASFILAGKAGFWGCECDVWETAHTAQTYNADGSYTPLKDTFDIVVMHDSTFQRMCGNSANVKDLTADEISQLSIISGNNIEKYSDEKVCFFSTYLSICKEYGMVPDVELKDGNMSQAALEKTVDLLYEYGLLQKALVVSFHPYELKDAMTYAKSQYGVSMKTYYAITPHNASSTEKAKELVWTASNLGLTGICLDKSLSDVTIVDYCDRMKLAMTLETD